MNPTATRPHPALVTSLACAALTLAAAACTPMVPAPSATATVVASPTAGLAPTAEPATPMPVAEPETVTVTNGAGTALAGTLYGGGSNGVLLAHMRPADQTSWQTFAPQLAATGWMVLTLDFSGYGQSDGERDDATLAGDVQAGLDYLNSRGATRLVCIGASMGGTACARAIQTPGLVGLVLISSPFTLGEVLTLTADDLANPVPSKLFVSAKLDSGFAADIELMHGWAADPKSLVLLSGVRHGTDLLDSTAVSDDGRSLETVLADFLATLR